MCINCSRKQQGPPPGTPPHPPLSGGPNDPPPAPVALHALLANLMPDVLLALVVQAVQAKAQDEQARSTKHKAKASEQTHRQCWTSGTTLENSEAKPNRHNVPQSLPPSGQHAIQLDLEMVSDVQALRGICENLQHEVDHLKCTQRDDGDEADDEDEPADKSVCQKKKKKLTKGKTRTYLLNRPLQELSAAEKTTRKELQECLDTAIFDVTGTSMDTIKTDDSDGGDANIVWNEQNFTYMGFGKDCDAETCTIRHKDISFTKKDIVAFTKDKFRNLKHKYAKCQKQKVVNKRKKRHKQLCKDRADPSVIEAYTKEYGADPALLLETEYMSEEISELKTDNEEAKKAHHKILLQKAGFIGSDKEDAVVWEVFNDIVEWINKIRHVNIGTVKDHAPEIPVYPFMLSNNWLAKFNHENPGTSLDIKTCNPRGFGPMDDQPDTQEQDNHGPGTTPENGGGEVNCSDDMDDGDM
ncbi:hypothetical protein EV702DRAFT_1050674 [Suillus placidus]|uniref:Uncharacterized protein n=1 Tax=Suillus placidus TaxID=48579 RepID=A0A9P6ZHP1_9AGAM|nr:hypothetical protein EV702DRAFT_1050674 [Suillus placidus]